MGNLVAIVGRPNVGKSTLFNRLTNSRRAIVSDEAGTTRDRQYGKCEWNGREFSVVDTGGWVVNSDDVFEEEIRKQVVVATEEADLVLFLVDIKNGLTDLDQDVALILRRSKLPVVLVANKADDGKDLYGQYEFYKLGLGDPFCVSAATGSGTGDLLDHVLSKLKTDEVNEVEDGTPRFAVVGRPNAGKSSIINAFIGEDRNIVTDIAGTTRDSIYTKYDKFGFDFYLVDTAGIRRKNKVTEDLEFYSVMRSVRTVEASDVCILMLDASQGLEQQDLNIFSLIQRNHKGVVIVVNKWDLVEKTTNTHRDFENLIKERIAPFDDVPIIFTSVINKQRIFKVLEAARAVHEARSRRIGTSELNDTLLPIVKEQNPPPSVKGKWIKIKYITQLPTPYPQFVFFCNLPQYIRDPYKRFVENRMRELWDFHCVPMNIYFRAN
jgi:GTP-binding protein